VHSGVARQARQNTPGLLQVNPISGGNTTLSCGDTSRTMSHTIGRQTVLSSDNREAVTGVKRPATIVGFLRSLAQEISWESRFFTGIKPPQIANFSFFNVLLSSLITFLGDQTRCGSERLLLRSSPPGDALRSREEKEIGRTSLCPCRARSGCDQG
jgi:hypothetical protein